MSSLFNHPKVKLFQQEILAYWDLYGRKDLPWRQTRDPWKILLTEIMLRKTTSEQVRAFYPTLTQWSPETIAEMDFYELVEQLKPLGLSQLRAQLLKRISSSFVGTAKETFFSDQYLRSFPGIGRYISNAVRCFVFNEPVPALDTNMIRVIERVFGWTSTRRRPREDKRLWDIAETLVPKDRPAEYNWGILDFGAAVCTAKKPKCRECPLNSICLFYRNRITTETSTRITGESVSE